MLKGAATAWGLCDWHRVSVVHRSCLQTVCGDHLLAVANHNADRFIMHLDVVKLHNQITHGYTNHIWQPDQDARFALLLVSSDSDASQCCLRLIPKRCYSAENYHSMNSLDTVVARLKKLAPLHLAESWDNVGLLVEPSGPKFVSKVMLTNDLTLQVMEEAKEETVDLIVSYHPPIFAPLKRITQKSWKERLVVDCIENRIAVFSPHTSQDAMAGGVNDWLLSTFDIKKSSVRPVIPSQEFPGGQSHMLEVTITDASRLKEVRDQLLISQLHPDSKLKQNREAFTSHAVRTSEGEQWKLKVECNKEELACMLRGLAMSDGPEKFQVLQLSKTPLATTGMGRWAKLKSTITVQEAVAKVKSHLGVEHVLLAHRQDLDKSDAESREATISTVAVCAGSGSSVLRDQAGAADLLLTGEMSHHDVLDAVHKGSYVILANHSNSERGYLHVLRDRLASALGASINVFVSKCDADPLKVV